MKKTDRKKIDLSPFSFVFEKEAAFPRFSKGGWGDSRAALASCALLISGLLLACEVGTAPADTAPEWLIGDPAVGTGATPLQRLARAPAPGTGNPTERTAEWPVNDPGPPGTGARADTSLQRLTILHTNDLHAHMLGVPNADYDPHEPGDGTRGGIARIAARVKEIRAAREAAGVPTLLLDGGDFTMGTLFHLLEGEAELGVMDLMGYDFICLGNHEFDGLPEGAARIASHATAAKLLSANLRITDPDDPGGQALQEQIDRGNILPYAVKELPGGLWVGVFGLMGSHADEVLFRPDPETYPVAFDDRIEVSRRIVPALRDTYDVDIVICVSHSGVDRGDHARGEDPALARAVPGIDVIVSGHSHTDMPEPAVTPGGTIIVQAQAYGQRLGVLDLERTEGGGWQERAYEYVVIDDTIPADPETQDLVEAYIRRIDEEFLRERGYAFRQRIARTDFDVAKYPGREHTLGDLVTDSIRWAVDRVENVPGHPREGAVAFAVESNGVIRSPVLRGRHGTILVSDAFRVVPLGFDPTASEPADRAGYPLVAFYLTGREVRLAAEVNATISPLLRMPSYWLSHSGLAFTYRSKGIPFRRVLEIQRCTKPVTEDPACLDREPLDTRRADPTLYKVACNYYVGLNIAALKKRTRGMLDVVPKHRDGSPIADLAEAIVRRPDGTSVKEFEGFLDHLASFPPDEEGVPVIPERYRNPQGRIVDSCFVATVAYGSPFAPQVDTFRRFRDDVLGQSPLGASLVAIYYRHGADVAGVVAGRAWLRAATRVLLLPAAGAAHLLLWVLS